MSKHKRKNLLALAEKFKDVKQNPNTVYADENLEKRILATMLAIQDKQLMALDYLSPEMFFYLKNKELFLLFKNWKKQLKYENIWFTYNDILNFYEDEIRNQSKEYPNISIEYLNEVATTLFNELNFLAEIDKLKELSNMRNLEGFFLEYAHQMGGLNNKLNFKDVLYDFSEYVNFKNDGALESGQFQSIEEVSNAFHEFVIDILQNNVNQFSLKTHYEGIDKYVNGFKPGQFIVLAARPGVGKTALALNIATNVASAHEQEQNNFDSQILSTTDNETKPQIRPKNVAFISLEMPVNELIARVISSTVQIPLYALQNPKMIFEDEMIKNKFNYFFTKKMNQMNIYFDDTATSKISDIVWKIKALVKSLDGQLDLIIIDYLQLISSSDATGNRQNEVSVISRTLKTLALELKVPIIALSQLSRSVENREDKRPQLHDLRESGSIEQDADIVIFLHRDLIPNTKANENAQSETGSNLNTQGQGSKTIVTVAKNRNGQPGSAEFMYYGPTVTFFDRHKNN
ncbi:DnaB-like helicase C-terminal domain-containing protein [Mycoplasma hafezii]|uniref:DnaB-like helicase C-terminal domain-containing protein n=1 Tax=Mycoplasma hafezii TaxID=525886 RepID=UPI003CF79983